MTATRNRANSSVKRRGKARPRSRLALAERVLLQPWFLPKRAAVAIHSLVPIAYWLKMRHVFDDYGCLVCGREAPYHSCGMCRLCYARTRKKIFLSVRRHATPEREVRLDLELFRQQRIAQKLLYRFALRRKSPPKRISAIQNNPVYEALAAKLEISRRPI